MDKKESSILIDTDVLINLFDPFKEKNSLADTTLSHLISNKTDLFVSVITEIEMLQGSKTVSVRNKLVKQLGFFKTLTINEEISITAKKLIISYSSSHGLLLGDSLIAATALHFNTPLFTFNLKDFRFIKDIKLYIL
jgi:predicted nucleic acid-binding protein